MKNRGGRIRIDYHLETGHFAVYDDYQVVHFC
jgi:hypothetical protein